MCHLIDGKLTQGDVLSLTEGVIQVLPFVSKKIRLAGFRTSNVPRVMQLSKNNSFCSLTLSSLLKYRLAFEPGQVTFICHFYFSDLFLQEIKNG